MHVPFFMLTIDAKNALPVLDEREVESARKFTAKHMYKQTRADMKAKRKRDVSSSSLLKSLHEPDGFKCLNSLGS